MDETFLAVSSVVGVLLSLIFSWTPKLKTKWLELEADQRRIFMSLFVAAFTVGLYVVACDGNLDVSALGLSFNCGGNTAEFVMAVIFALVSNQAAYNLTPKGKSKLAADNPADVEPA